MSEYVHNETKVIRPYKQVGVYTKEQVVGILQEIRREIKAYRVDKEQSDEYNEGFDDGIGYAVDVIDGYIAKYKGEQA